MTPRFQEDAGYDKHLGFARAGFPASYQQRFDQRFPEKNPAPGIRTYGSQERLEFRDRFIAIYESELTAELKKTRKPNREDSVTLTDEAYEQIFRAIYESDFKVLVDPKSNPWALLKQWETKSPRETASDDLDRRISSWPKYKRDSLWASIFDLTERDQEIDFNKLLLQLTKSADPERELAEENRKSMAKLAEKRRQKPTPTEPIASLVTPAREERPDENFEELTGPKLPEKAAPVLVDEPALINLEPELLVIDQGRLKLKDPATGTMVSISNLLPASRPVEVGQNAYLVIANHLGTRKRELPSGMSGHCAVFAVEVRATEIYENQIRYFWDLNEQTGIVSGALTESEIEKFKLKQSA